MRIWGKLFKENHMIKDHVAEINNSDGTMSRTKVVFVALEELCHEFDIAQPIWLDKNIKEFQAFAKTKFRADSFMESIEFDYFEFHVIEED